MQSLSSGLSYACSGAKRAAKPVIESLAPILPTFGYRKAVVKKSVGNCIHEREATAVEKRNVNAGNKGYEWRRQNDGARAAEQHVGSFVKTVFIHLIADT